MVECMVSPIGSSAQFSCSTLGFSICDISLVSPQFRSRQLFVVWIIV